MQIFSRKVHFLFIISFFVVSLSTQAAVPSSTQTPLEEKLSLLDKVDYSKMSNTQLKKLIMGICEDFQVEDMLETLDMPITQCFVNLLKNKTVDRQTLIECADQVLNYATRTCPSKLSTILEKVCKLQEKAACDVTIAIDEPTIISEPGSYCLSQDIMGTVTIAADQVFLDLNEKTISGGTNGIEVSNQEDVFIRNGTIKNMTTDGILIDTCTNVMISDIEFIASATGIAVLTTTCVRIEHCTFKEHTSEAICLDNTNNGQIIDNKAINNTDGIVLRNASVENMIAQNTCNDNIDGICLSSSSNNNISGNTCNNNFGFSGIRLLSSSSNNILSENICNNNTFIGIGLFSSSNNVFSKNTCNNNTGGEEGGIGIFLLSSNNNTLSENTCNNNTDNGISLESSDNNTLSENTCNNNTDNGIELERSNNNVLSENVCNSNSTDGILTDSANNNTISKNMCNNNTDDGIDIGGGSGSNTVVFNSTNENGDTGINDAGISTDVFNNSAVDNTTNYSASIMNVCTPTDLLTTVSCGANFAGP